MIFFISKLKRNEENKSETRVTASILKQDSNMGTVMWCAYKFNMTIQNVHIFKVSPFFKQQKQQLNSEKCKYTCLVSVVVCSECLEER